MEVLSIYSDCLCDWRGSRELLIGKEPGKSDRRSNATNAKVRHSLLLAGEMGQGNHAGIANNNAVIVTPTSPEIAHQQPLQLRPLISTSNCSSHNMPSGVIQTPDMSRPLRIVFRQPYIPNSSKTTVAQEEHRLPRRFLLWIYAQRFAARSIDIFSPSNTASLTPQYPQPSPYTEL
jgi:hypothetical protein